MSEVQVGVVINDCRDPNARARQQIRFRSLFGFEPVFVGLDRENADLEAAGHLVDTLDASRIPDALGSVSTVVLVNAAPRGDDVREKWENGTPFCKVEAGGAMILAPYEGRSLGLVKKLGLAGKASLFDIPKVTQFLVKDGTLTDAQATAIKNSQFRSLEFLPLAAKLLSDGVELPAEDLPIKTPAVDNRIWHIDNFGNAKTTVLQRDSRMRTGQTVRLIPGHEAIFYQRLADVPSDQLGVTVGSSGYGDDRWLEIVQQRGSAAEKLDLKVGQEVLS